jgi:hypothetical protein
MSKIRCSQLEALTHHCDSALRLRAVRPFSVWRLELAEFSPTWDASQINEHIKPHQAVLDALSEMILSQLYTIIPNDNSVLNRTG